MTIIQYVISIALLCLGGLAATTNGWILVRQLLGKSSPSIVPFVGGMLLFSGAAIFPGGSLKPWAVLGLILDVGCIPYFVLASIYMLQYKRKYAPKNRLISIEYDAKQCTGKFHLYPDSECIHEWSAKNDLTSGGMTMKIVEYIPSKIISLALQDILIILKFNGKAWMLEHEEGSGDEKHSLKDSVMTVSRADSMSVYSP